MLGAKDGGLAFLPHLYVEREILGSTHSYFQLNFTRRIRGLGTSNPVAGPPIHMNWIV